MALKLLDSDLDAMASNTLMDLEVAPAPDMATNGAEEEAAAAGGGANSTGVGGGANDEEEGARPICGECCGC